MMFSILYSTGLHSWNLIKGGGGGGGGPSKKGGRGGGRVTWAGTKCFARKGGQTCKAGGLM